MNLALIGFTTNNIDEKININSDEIISLNLVFKNGRKIKNIKSARVPLMMFALSFVKIKIAK
tara:strand:+ start:254 stop:439 length:186 start_codon:yes stop_codon:yes gene_type:complete